MKYSICFLICLQILLHSTIGFRFKQNNKIVCRNEITGQELDWYTLYKLPKLHSHSIDLVNNGTAYVFMTNEKQNWFLSTLSINSTQSFPAKTLEPLYNDKINNNTDIGYILYSDQADEVTFIKGHAKGVILFDENTAVWIVHSIPHYPPKKSDQEYFIRPPQCYFGQSMLCMSYSFDQLELIGQQLLFTYPQVYDYYIPDKFKYSKSYSKVLSNLMRVINNEHVEQEPWYSSQKLTTLGGEEMISFSKYTEFEDDLYSGLVAPSLKSSLLTETWNNGNGTFPSNCSSKLDYHVMNIEEVEFDFINLNFSVHNDHSKWTVTTKSDTNNDEMTKIACIGDINRQEDQLRRGGGTVCFLNNQNVWNEYHKIVSKIETCPASKYTNIFININKKINL